MYCTQPRLTRQPVLYDASGWLRFAACVGTVSKSLSLAEGSSSMHCESAGYDSDIHVHAGQAAHARGSPLSGAGWGSASAARSLGCRILKSRTSRPIVLLPRSATSLLRVGKLLATFPVLGAQFSLGGMMRPICRIRLLQGINGGSR